MKYLKIFFHELSGVAPSLIHDKGEMKKNNKEEFMNEESTIPIDILKESPFHVIDGCAWLWKKVGNIKDLYSYFGQTLSIECGTNINQISVLFDGYTVESTKGPEQKYWEKNLSSVEMKVDWNLPVPQNMKNFLTRSNNKQQLIGLLAQKLLIDGIHVKQATGDADILIMKEDLIKAEEFDNAVVHSRDTDVFIYWCII